MIDLKRIGNTLVYAEDGAPPGAPGFLAFALADAASPPAQMTLDQAWSDPALAGHFVFLSSTPADLQTFAEALKSSGILPVPAHTSFAWTDYPAGITAKKAFLLEIGSDLLVAADARLSFGRYALPVRKGFRISTAAGPDFAIDIEYPAEPGYPGPRRKGLRLPFSGDGRFCLEGEGLINDFSGSAKTGWDAGIRYFAKTETGVAELRYPLLKRVANYYFHFRTRWDPLSYWFPAGRTRLAFTGAAYRLASSISYAGPAILESGFRTIYDETVTLRPLAGAALVPQPIGTGANREFYLAPSGEFELGVHPPVDASEERRLLCGLAGTEFIAFRPGDVLFAKPSQPAFARTANPELSADYLTSWLGVVPKESASPAIYYAQPKQAPLFQQTDPASPNLLGFFPAPAAVFTDSSAPVFPMAPYGAASGSNLESFESQVLNPARRAAIEAEAQRAPVTKLGTGPTVTTTPQGFLATVDGLDWSSVLLAKNQTSKGAVSAMQFRNLPPLLRGALQSNQLFLVVTDAANLGGFDKEITIADWPFRVNVGSPTSNILIFKFCRGSLRERARDVASWSSAAKFNTDPERVALSIDAYIANAEQEVDINPRLERFLEIVEDPAWNGVLALKVDISLQSFPNDIKGLLAGIDQTRFYAHHFGIEVNYIQAQGGLQMPPQSSLFGLIGYVDKDSGGTVVSSVAPPLRDTPEDPAYAFRVLNLHVVFENSRIIDFASRIALTITKLFGEAAERERDADNASLKNTVELNGSYEDHQGVPYYSFQSTNIERFLLPQSRIFHYIDLVKAQFHTFQSQDSNEVSSRFSFLGFLNFEALSNLDLFSFGDPAGLQFSNLGVNMTFELDPPTDPLFIFDPSGVSFDLGSSSPRPGSLFNGFPLKLSNIDSGSAARSPRDAGYLPVMTPLEDIAPLEAEWYGITYGVDLGTMGALAESAGFTATLLAAWSPGGEIAKVAVMMKLPGTAVGKKELSLQGVLKLKIGQMSLEEQPDSPGVYLMRFKNIGLAFLGVKLPTGYTADLVLFGDPTRAEGGTNLGWYGAFYSNTPPAA